MESFRSGDLLFISCVFHFPLSTIAAGALRRLLLFFLFHCSIVPPHFYSYQLFFFFFFIYPIFPFFNGTLEQKRKTMFIFTDISCLIVVPVPFPFCSTLLVRFQSFRSDFYYYAQKNFFLRREKIFPTHRKNVSYAQENDSGTKGLCPFWGSVLSLQAERPIPPVGAIVILCRKE